jgi:response regulator RpfG family c-di-GMP phosphodiesterase
LPYAVRCRAADRLQQPRRRARDRFDSAPEPFQFVFERLTGKSADTLLCDPEIGEMLGAGCPTQVCLGVELIRRGIARRIHAHAPDAVGAGDQADREFRLRALEAGADDFLTTPIDRAELLARVRSLAHLKRHVDEMDSASSIISTLAVMVETRDGHSEGHCHRMANYPDGLKGDQVPLLAQIVGICDAFDAITSKRAYHEQQPAAIAITVLQRQVELGWRRPDLIALFTEPVQQGRLDELPLGAPALTTSTPSV